MRLLRRWLHKLMMKLETVGFGKCVTVYFPVEDQYEKVIVSSLRAKCFTGKFLERKRP